MAGTEVATAATVGTVTAATVGTAAVASVIGIVIVIATDVVTIDGIEIEATVKAGSSLEVNQTMRHERVRRYAENRLRD